MMREPREPLLHLIPSEILTTKPRHACNLATVVPGGAKIPNSKILPVTRTQGCEIKTPYGPRTAQ